MDKKYIEIKFGIGETLAEAVNTLKVFKNNNQLACGSFNGIMLYSDIDDADSIYKKVTGKTKAEFDKEEKRERDDYKEKERKHKEAIPELTKEWIEKGKDILDEKYLELWKECVPIRLDDIYQGMELGATLEIVKELNNGCKLEVAKEIIKKQGHSGMSHGLVCSMIKSFCDRGTEFVNFIKEG